MLVFGMNEAPVQLTDARLLHDAAHGDANAFAILFRRHVGPVTLYAVRRCNDPEDVADLVADTFLIALQAAGRYIPETDTALPWLFGIARRVLARQRRRSAGAIDASRQAPALEAALACLSSGEREVLELVAYDGLSPSEAAMVLNLSPNAARLRLSRARRHLRHLLEGPAIEAEARHAF
jgi:RNA polymerase sigma-70 factor (ECF subfamily)